MSDKPFFSFLLITYKQAQYVEEAFKACVSQTKDDYEIVISDDNSPDNTWDVLTRLVEEYQMTGGNIPIIMNRNEKNLGIGGNFQKAADLSHGTWLLMAAGDDVSLPNRLEIIKNVVENHPNAYGINTARYFVDEKTQNPQYNFQRDYLLGADSVWRKELFSMFNPMDSRVMSEDHILNLRALLLGEIVQLNTPTIYYRISGSNISLQKSKSSIDEKRFMIKKKTYLENLIESNFEDLELYSRIYPLPQKQEVVDKLNGLLSKCRKEKKSYQKYLSVAESSIRMQLKYIFTPSDIWLHDKMFYRLFNVMKMHGIIPNKHYAKESPKNIVTQDNQEYVITIGDYIARTDLY